jgi:hypothetical protein
MSENQLEDYMAGYMSEDDEPVQKHYFVARFRPDKHA